MRKLLLILFFGFPLAAFCSTADSLIQRLQQSAPEEIQTVIEKTYRAAAREDSMTFYTFDQQAREFIHQEHKHHKDYVDVLAEYRRAKWHMIHDRTPEALATYVVLEKKLQTVPFQELHIRTLLSLASTYSELGSADESIKYGLMATDLFPESMDTVNMVEVLNLLGESYRVLEEYEQAIAYYDRGLVLTAASQDTMYTSRLLNNKGIAFSQLNRFEEAYDALNQGLELANAKGNRYGQAILLTNLGFNAKNAKEYDRALEYYNQSLEIKEEFGRPASIAYTLNDIGETYYFLGDYASALSYSKRAFKMAEEAQVLVYMRDMSLTLSNTYVKTEQWDSAYFYQNRYQEIQNEILSESNLKEVARLERQHELREKDLQNQLLQANNEQTNIELTRQRLINIGAMVGLVFLFAIGFILWNSNRVRRRLLEQVEAQNEALDQKNQRLNRLLNEQESLFNIVTHDLKGPLINAQRLLAMHDEVPASERGVLQGMLRRSVDHAMDFIQDFNLLMEFERMDQLPPAAPFDMVALVNSVLQGFETTIQQKHLSIHFNDESAVEVKGIESYTRHILHNLVSNAVKYSPQRGSIFITITQSERTRISIENQGPGIETDEINRIFERFYRGRNGSQDSSSNGIGLSLVKLLVQRLDGEVKVTSIPDQKTEFVVYFTR